LYSIHYGKFAVCQVFPGLEDGLWDGLKAYPFLLPKIVFHPSMGAPWALWGSTLDEVEWVTRIGEGIEVDITASSRRAGYHSAKVRLEQGVLIVSKAVI